MKVGRLHDTIEHISIDAAESSSKLVPANTLLLVVRGMALAKMLPIAITQRSMAFNQDLKALKPKDGISGAFLYYWLSANADFVLSKADEAAHGTKRLQTPALEDLIVRLPKDYREQEQIVSHLAKIDDWIDNLEQRVQLLEEAARLIYTEWFVRRRFPGYKYQSSEQLPAGWSHDRLDSVLTLQRGFDLPAEERVDADTPIIASTGVCGTHSTHKVTGPGVVTGRSGTLGKVHLIQQDFWPLNTTLWVKEYRGISPYFAYFLLQTLNLASLNVGASVPSLDRNTVHPLPVVIPNAAMLAKFDETVIPIFQQIATLKKQIDATKQARDLLLPRLISGQLRL